MVMSSDNIIFRNHINYVFAKGFKILDYYCINVPQGDTLSAWSYCAKLSFYCCLKFQILLFNHRFCDQSQI